jgi:hypothetical protein
MQSTKSKTCGGDGGSADRKVMYMAAVACGPMIWMLPDSLLLGRIINAFPINS